MIYAQLSKIPATLNKPSVRLAIRGAAAHKGLRRTFADGSGCYSSVYHCEDPQKILKVTVNGDGTSDYLDWCWEMTKSGRINEMPWAPRVYGAQRHLVTQQERKIKPDAECLFRELTRNMMMLKYGSPEYTKLDEKYGAIHRDPNSYYYVPTQKVVRVWIIEKLNDNRRYSHEEVGADDRSLIRAAVGQLCPWLHINDDHSGNYLWSDDRQCWVLTDPATGRAQNIVKVPLVRH